MPRPTEQQLTYMALCVITELDEVARKAALVGRESVTVRDRLCEVIRSGGQVTPEMLAPFVDRAEAVGAEVRELEGNVRNLANSEYALNLARRSLT